MSNKLVREQLIHIYGNTCFLGDTPTSTNVLTLHHIAPVRDGRITTIYNGALITENMHWLFNILESDNPIKAEEINNYLIYYKETMDDEVRMIIHEYMVEYAIKRKLAKETSKLRKIFTGNNDYNDLESRGQIYTLKKNIIY